MTTFQIIVQTVGIVALFLTPFPTTTAPDLFEAFLQWSRPEVNVLILFQILVALSLVLYFRFDWLGVLTAIFKTTVQPRSIRSQERNLDQQLLLFLSLATLPAILIKIFLISNPIQFPIQNTLIGFFVSLMTFAILHFSMDRNRFLRGLNHLRLLDATLLGVALAVTAFLPSFSVLAICWFVLGTRNYHPEAIVKASFLVLAICFTTDALLQIQPDWIYSLSRDLGWMNLTVCLTLAITAIWLSLEQLDRWSQKGRFTDVLRSFRNFQIPVALAYLVATYFFPLGGQ